MLSKKSLSTLDLWVRLYASQNLGSTPLIDLLSHFFPHKTKAADGMLGLKKMKKRPRNKSMKIAAKRLKALLKPFAKIWIKASSLKI